MKSLLAFLLASAPLVVLGEPAFSGLTAEESAVLRTLIAKVDAKAATQGSASGNPTLVGKTTETYDGDQTYSQYGALSLRRAVASCLRESREIARGHSFSPALPH